jgi:hypothetical protein
MRTHGLASMSVLWSLGALVAQEREFDDRVVAGYVAAVLERDFGLPAAPVTVHDGRVELVDRDFGPLERQRLAIVLRALPGVREVTFVQPEPGLAAPAAASTLFLSTGRLFEPLLADPRWPHFFASWHYYLEDRDRAAGTEPLEQIGAVGFGETLAFARSRGTGALRWEAGLQAGVFAIFDLDRASKDLVNADYTIGPYLAGRHRDTSLLLRLRHQSSHLGDEYVLREQITGSGRVNLSYETVDVVASHELPAGFRPYAGGSYLLAAEPADLESWTLHYGLEWRGQQPFGAGAGMWPVAAVDCKQRQENDWGLDASVRAGVVFEDVGRQSQRLAVLLEWYDGYSPNGQFYTDRVQFLGLGVHFYF